MAQPFAHGETADGVSRHHDSVFSADVKVGTPFAGRVRTAGVLGFDVARRDTDRSGTVSGGLSPTTPFNASLSDVVWATTAGLDVSVRVAPKVAILAVGRAHFLVDDDRQPDGVVRRGVSSVVLRAGAGVQVRF